ncbi:MAG: RluA family pseudouridine synthase [Polyangiaceae bacterium]
MGSADGSIVGDVLARAGADDRAVLDGRVFVGRRRVRHAGEAIHEGDVVEIAAERESPDAVVVLAQSQDLVAVDKPAGIPTIADHAGSAHALLALAARALGIDAARIHPTSRLDRDVSGVVVLALTKAAAERLSRARKEGTYDRRYVAVASRAPEPASGAWTTPIGRAQRSPRLRAANGRDAVPASTRYAVCARASGGEVMLSLAPLTGRTHQIRVHAAHAGAALVGDRAYGGPARVTLASGRVLEPARIALHALRVVVPGSPDAPDAKEATFVAFAPVPPALESLWSALGGEPASWDRAASWDLRATPS